jgi:hypothetical protein
MSWTRSGYDHMDRSDARPTQVASNVDGIALMMTREILSNAEELEDLRRSAEESARGEIHWLDEDE